MDHPAEVSTGAASGRKAVILAGGKGTRLRPFTASFPKPLVPLGDVPVVEVLILNLIRHGINDVTLTLGHLAELVETYLQRRKPITEHATLRFVTEPEPTGTAGSLASVPDLDDTFLVMNGDLLTDLDFHQLVEFHREREAVLTIATHARRVQIDLGVLEFDGDQRVTAYHEKPETTHHVSMGVYVYEPSVLECIPTGEYLDFPNLVLRLLDQGRKVCSFLSDSLWLDIGRPDDYARAQELFADMREDVDRV